MTQPSYDLSDVAQVEVDKAEQVAEPLLSFAEAFGGPPGKRPLEAMKK